jgi:hypothetical protein
MSRMLASLEIDVTAGAEAPLQQSRPRQRTLIRKCPQRLGTGCFCPVAVAPARRLGVRARSGRPSKQARSAIRPKIAQKPKTPRYSLKDKL